MDKRRLHRELLKQALFNADCSNIPVRKEIIVDLRYLDNKHWLNYGHVEIVSDGPNGFSQFTTHQENPLQYAKNRIKEDKLKDFKLVIKK